MNQGDAWFRTSRGRVVQTSRGRTTREALLASGAWSPTQGVMVPASTVPREVVRAVLEVLPSHLAASHLTAARFHGIPLPNHWSPQEPIHVSAVPPQRAPQRRGIRGHQDSALVTVQVDGVSAASLSSTWRQLTSLLPINDLVAAADNLLGRRCPEEGLITIDLLATALAAGGRGVERGREALKLADGGAASARESHLRLLVLSWGIPAPATNQDMYDDHGQWLGVGDLVWEEERVVAEYEGDHHRTDAKQWHHDVARSRLLRDAGWEEIRVTRRDMRRPRELRGVLERALQRNRKAA